MKNAFSCFILFQRKFHFCDFRRNEKLRIFSIFEKTGVSGGVFPLTKMSLLRGIPLKSAIEYSTFYVTHIISRAQSEKNWKNKYFQELRILWFMKKTSQQTKWGNGAFINISEQAKSRLLISLRLGNDIYEILLDMEIQCCIAEEQAKLKRII